MMPVIEQSDRLLQLEWRKDEREPDMHFLCFGGAVLGEVEALEDSWLAVMWVSDGLEPGCAKNVPLYRGPHLHGAKQAVELEALACMRAALKTRGQL